MRAPLVLAVVAALAGGCSAALDFHECSADSDCNGGGDAGTALVCTHDHLCVDPTPCSVSVQTGGGSPLVVAGLYKLSGPGTNDHAIREAGDLAALELGTLGRSVEHVVCDTAADPARAAQALKVAVDVFGAVAVVGPDTSAEVAQGVAGIVKAEGAVIVSPAATNPAIAQLDDDGLIWRTAPSDDVQSQVLAQLVTPTTAKLDLVYVDKDLYATGIEQAFTAAWKGTVDKAIVFETGMAAAAVAQLDQPDYALLIAHVDAPALVAAAGMQQSAVLSPTTKLVMTDAALAPSLYGAPPYDFTFLARISGTAPGLPSGSDPSAGVYAAFSTDYRAHFDNEDPGSTAWVANAYDAFYLIALAAGAAQQLGQKLDGRHIAAQLGRLSTPGAPAIEAGPSDFLKGVDDLAQGDIDFVGASGPDDFDAATGDVKTAPIEVWTIVQGADGNPQFSTLQTITP